MITISLSPNTQRDDIIIALKTLLAPWKWKEGQSITEVENWFRSYFDTKDVLAVNSARSAMFLLLQSFGIGKDDEVIVQAFTCLAVPEVVKWVGAKPIYVDIDDSLNINYKLLEKAITPKTKAIIVQHTFGIPAQIDMITKIAHKNNIIMIEDCAHSLGATYMGKKLGTWGDAAFFSFGRDKVISSVFGGMAMINPTYRSKKAKISLAELGSKLKYPNSFWTFQQLLHPVAFSLIIPLYQAYLGKILLVMLQHLHLLSFPIYDDEKKGLKPVVFPKLYPNGLAILILNQIQKIEKLNQHRKNMALTYFQQLSKKKNIVLPPKVDGAIYLRFNILVRNPDTTRLHAREIGIMLGNWYHDVIDPTGSSSVADYHIGSCPKSEQIAKCCLNLPTNITVTTEEVDKIIKSIEF